jgi:uncharacterized protein (TIGR02266 family)
MEQKQKILAIVPQQNLFDKLSEMLGRDSFEVSRAANATGSLILATNVAYDLIVAEYPLPDLSIVDFLGILQAPTLPSADSPILLITRQDHVEGVEKHVADNELVTVASQDSSADSLHSVLAQSLSGVAARKASRLMVQIEAEIDAGKLLRVCQTSNVSETGMLIHTSRLLPLDTEVDISFYLPGDPRPIDGKVMVVRHTDATKEALAGMGVHFTDLATASRDKLRDFVSGRWVAPDDLLAVIPEIAAEAP